MAPFVVALKASEANPLATYNVSKFRKGRLGYVTFHMSSKDGNKQIMVTSACSVPPRLRIPKSLDMQIVNTGLSDRRVQPLLRKALLARQWKFPHVHEHFNLGVS